MLPSKSINTPQGVTHKDTQTYIEYLSCDFYGLVFWSIGESDGKSKAMEKV